MSTVSTRLLTHTLVVSCVSREWVTSLCVAVCHIVLQWVAVYCALFPAKFRSVPMCHKHPASPGQNLIHGGAIWVVGIWPQLLGIQLPQLKSVLPQLKYQNLWNWSTLDVLYALSTLSTGVSCLPFSSLQRMKQLFLWTVPYRNERIRTNLYPTKVLVFWKKTTQCSEWFSERLWKMWGLSRVNEWRDMWLMWIKSYVSQSCRLWKKWVVSRVHEWRDM